MLVMESEDPAKPPEVPLGEVFSEIPLFREIQRVLLSSTGPVNWELARQVGIAMASWGTEDPAPTDEDRRGLEDTVRAAELHVAEFTGLPQPADVAPVEALRRGQWVEVTIGSLKELVEPAATRMGEVFTRAQQEENVPPEAAEMAGAMMGQLAPLLLGAQVGTVLGYLGQRVLGQYDLAIPHPGAGTLRFVVPNIAKFEREWSIPPVEFRAWVALHEVAHRFQFAGPWTRRHFVDVVRDYLSTLEFDLAGLQERLGRLDYGNPEALQQLFQSEEGLLGPVVDDEQRLKLGRIQAFMAAAEGHGEHVSERVGSRLLGTHARIQEAVRRNREAEATDPVFERLLGIEMKREQYRLGKSFCDRVVELTDEATLGLMWDSAEALPSMPELEEPRLWLARMA
jgi:putative hydrolase